MNTYLLSVRLICTCTLFLTSCLIKSQLIRNYADTASGSYVDDKDNALNADDNTFAKIKSYGGLALGIGAYSGNLNLSFNTPIAGNTTSYTRIGFNESILNGLVGGGLGNLLTTILQGVILGNHYFSVTYKNGNSDIYSFSSSNMSSSDNISKIVMDGKGFYYLKSKVPTPYNTVSIKDHTAALLLGTFNETRIFYHFYNTGESSCNEMMTSFDADGGVLSIDLLNLGQTGVSNPKNAIDNSLDSYSNIGLGLLSVAGSIKQSFHLGQKAGTTSEILLLVQFDNPALLNLGILDDAIQIDFLKNGNVVKKLAVNNDFLDLDVLGLLNDSKKAFVRFKPEVEFDEYRVVLQSLVNLNVGKSLKIYDASVINSEHSITKSVCSDFYDLRAAIPDYNVNTTYSYYNLDGSMIANPQSVPVSNTYYIKGISNATFCSDEFVEIKINKEQCKVISNPMIRSKLKR